MNTKIKIAAFITAVGLIVLILLGLDIVKMEHLKELSMVISPIVTGGVIWIFKDDEVKEVKKDRSILLDEVKNLIITKEALEGEVLYYKDKIDN